MFGPGMVLALCHALQLVGAAEKPDFPLYTFRAVSALLEGRPAPVLATRTPSCGVFVTIEVEGKVVGCRGTLSATKATLEEEVLSAATSAALHDARYGPVRLDGRRFAVTLTLVSRLDPISSVAGLEPSDGLVLRSGEKVGVVLPWEGKDPRTRLSWAYTKAGVAQGASVRLERMTAQRFRYPETTH